MNDPVEQRYYTIGQASIYLGLSRKTLYKWAERGEMPGHKVGRVWRFDRCELDEFVRGSHGSRSLFLFDGTSGDKLIRRRSSIMPSSAVGIGRKEV